MLFFFEPSAGICGTTPAALAAAAFGYFGAFLIAFDLGTFGVLGALGALGALAAADFLGGISIFLSVMIYIRDTHFILKLISGQ